VIAFSTKIGYDANMTSKLMEKKISNLNQEVALLRSAVLSVVGETDPEGAYRPEFVKDILYRARSPHSSHRFTNAKDFLSLTGRKK